jgi:hypothetical protein
MTDVTVIVWLTHAFFPSALTAILYEVLTPWMQETSSLSFSITEKSVACCEAIYALRIRVRIVDTRP